MDGSFDLDRFVQAQESVYAAVREELGHGLKQSHWMWFVFPQIAGLGQSRMARKYAISNATEAGAYLGHPILGARLRECTRRVVATEGRTVHQIFGSPDDLKFHSCMTLFGCVAPDELPFRSALSRFFNGILDEKTLERLYRLRQGPNLDVGQRQAGMAVQTPPNTSED